MQTGIEQGSEDMRSPAAVLPHSCPQLVGEPEAHILQATFLLSEINNIIVISPTSGRVILAQDFF
jgi:hypothetical protein